MERVRCPEILDVASVNMPPYFELKNNGNNSDIRGIFENLLKVAVHFCCQEKTNYTFTNTLSRYDSYGELIKNNTIDIILPVYGDPTKKYVAESPYIPLVEPPGIVYLQADLPGAQEAFIQSLSGSWPILVTILLSSLIVGALFWIFEHAGRSTNVQNGRMDVSSVLGGPWDGFYWAIVTMTTVGYGDLCPKSISGRSLAFIWILLGTAIVSMFTASITTGLLTASLSNDVSLHGKNMAVIKGSPGYYFAVKRNAQPVEFESMKEISEALSSQSVDGTLLDTYIASHYEEFLHPFQLADYIPHVFSYGLVLNRKGVWLERCFRKCIKMRDHKLNKIISSSTLKPFKNSAKDASASKEKSTSLFDTKSTALQFTFIAIIGLFCLFAIIGIIWDKWHVQKSTKDSKCRNLTIPDIRKHQMKETYLLLTQMKSDILNVDNTLQTVMDLLKLKGNFDLETERETPIMRHDMQLMY